MAVLYSQHFAQFFDDNGDPLSGGKLYTYAAGTSTPKATYTDAGGATPSANPVILDSAGRATIFLNGAYKFTLKTSADVLVKETDNVTAFSTQASSVDSITTSFTEDVITAADSVIFSDASDSGNTKRDTVQGLLDLVPSSGALVYLGSATASASSALDFTSLISSTYDEYVFIGTNIRTSANTDIALRCSTNNGSSWDTTAGNYDGYNNNVGNGSATATQLRNSGYGSSVDAIYFGLNGDTTNGNHNFTIGVHNPLGTSSYKHFSTQTRHYSSVGTNVQTSIGGFVYKSTTAVNAIRFIPQSGNIASGTIRLYGVAKS